MCPTLTLHDKLVHTAPAGWLSDCIVRNGNFVNSARTLFEKIWAAHIVADLREAGSLLHVDRHILHDLVAGPALKALADRGRAVRNPELTFATADHGVTSRSDRAHRLNPSAHNLLQSMRTRTSAAGIRLFDLGKPGQGIVHVIGPELGLTLPGTVIVCGDSHSCTHGGLGALAFGIGTSEVTHVLATQTIRQRRPRTMLLQFDGSLARHVSAKDLILFTISRLGSRAGQGFAVEYAGAAVRSMDVESRLTLCNLSIELGAKVGMVAPDDTTINYIAGRPFAPTGVDFEQASTMWRGLVTDERAQYDQRYCFDASEIAPQVSWGTNPEDSIDVDGRIPDPGDEPDPHKRRRLDEALKYMGLTPRTPVAEVSVDWVFIGSCANGRLSDLRAAAAVAKDRKVAPGVRAWVVPGSVQVKRAAEAEGLDRVFVEAGFEWREPGCSLCFGSNDEHLMPGERSVSTSNRNFIGRQGIGVRTHLASPATAAASAIAGHIADVRHMMDAA
jgi:3-isopropylmalate/(R)-2-methylmalate dehydratase large subunit